MIVSLIAAASANNVIGKNNQLLWCLPNDMRFFKNTTWAMPVIMGRKTYESLGKPLTGRYNFVITRRRDWNPGSNVQVLPSLGQAIAAAAQTDCKEVFIIGGGQIYAESMAIADKIYLTRVHANLEGDAYFPAFSEDQWKLESNIDFPADDRHAYAYSFQLWKKK